MIAASTQAYLDACTGTTAAFDQARTAIRAALPAITAVAKSGADLTGALVTLGMDETHVNVLALQYEAADKAKSLARISAEVAQAINNFLQVLAQQEDVAARIQAAAQGTGAG